ncbi:MAG: hypothetical protein KKF67_03935 [Nanoarchaeota archaeon]|nr:hypothetical protein [Nanoarchaeota archaeon]
MLKDTSSRFRTLFLLQFTRELIKNSKPKEFFIQPKKSAPKFIPSRNISVESSLKFKKRFIAESPPLMFKPSPVRPIMKRPPSRGLGGFYIPEPTLPPRLQNIYPSPTNKDIDLEKLNPLIRDPAVKIIECNGPGEKILVRGNMGTKLTSISLTQNEIDNMIERFSEEAKIPITEGVFNVAVGRLILTALISEIVSPKFVIKKMTLSLNKIQRVPGPYAR